MIKKTFLALISISFLPLSLCAKIINAQTIEEARPYIDQDCWFLVDLDNTLYQAKQALGHTEWFDYEIKQRMKNGMEKEEAINNFNPHWIESQKICEVMPVEPHTPHFIEELQRSGITVMGFTHRPCTVLESTLQQIKSIGVDFSKTAVAKDPIVLPAKKDKAMFIDGVIFSGSHNPKGEILDLFFEHLGYKPSKIVFLDDKDYNLNSLEDLLAGTGIDYIGILYRGVDNYPKIFDPEVAKLQFQWMNKIISNDMALHMLAKEDNG